MPAARGRAARANRNVRLRLPLQPAPGRSQSPLMSFLYWLPLFFKKVSSFGQPRNKSQSPRGIIFTWVITLTIRARSNGIPSPKSQVPLVLASPNMTFEPTKRLKYGSVFSKFKSCLFYAKKLDPTLILNTSFKPRLQKVLYVSIPRTWDPHVKWQVLTSVLSPVELPRIDLKWLGTWDNVWTNPISIHSLNM